MIESLPSKIAHYCKLLRSLHQVIFSETWGNIFVRNICILRLITRRHKTQNQNTNFDMHINLICYWCLCSQPLGTADIGVPGYGDLTPYSSLWDQHHGPGTALSYHGSHPELLGFASELWSAAPHNNGHTRAQCMIQQRYMQALLHSYANCLCNFLVLKVRRLSSLTAIQM
jgi:hypothetical protein